VLGKTLDLDAKIGICDRCVENLNVMQRFRLHPVHGPGPGMDEDFRAGNVLHSAVRAVITHMWRPAAGTQLTSELGQR
jgi:hypothetical protein